MEPGVDRRIAELAEGQHGVVSRGQLLALGLTNSGIGRRIEAGRLHRRHMGIYAVGHRLLSEQGVWMAAVLACGPEAVVSHRAAAALWDLRPDSGVLVDVTTPSGRGHSRSSIRAHCAELGPDETTIIRRIPCTSVERTLLDLAAEVDRRSLELAVERAEILRVLDWSKLRQAVEGAGPRRGVATLRSLVARYAAAEPTRSELEHRFLDLCESAALPRPAVNALMELPGGRLEVDFLWASARLIVETDGAASHHTQIAFARDRIRDQRLTVAGYRVVRFTWSQVVREPRAVSRTLRTLLGS